MGEHGSFPTCGHPALKTPKRGEKTFPDGKERMRSGSWPQEEELFPVSLHFSWSWVPAGSRLCWEWVAHKFGGVQAQGLQKPFHAGKGASSPCSQALQELPGMGRTLVGFPPLPTPGCASKTSGDPALSSCNSNYSPTHPQKSLGAPCSANKPLQVFLLGNPGFINIHNVNCCNWELAARCRGCGCGSAAGMFSRRGEEAPAVIAAMGLWVWAQVLKEQRGAQMALLGLG